MLKRGTVAWLIWNIIEAILLITAGILCMAWSGNNDFQKVAVLVAGIILIIEAGMRLLLGVFQVFTAGNITVVKTNTAQATAGAAELALGICLCYIYSHYDPAIVNGVAVAGGKAVFGYVGIYIGIFLLVLSFMFIVNGIVFTIKKFNTTIQNIFSIFVGVVFLVAGIVSLFNLNPEKGDNVVQFFLVMGGLIALFSGLFVGIGAVLVLVANKAVKNVMNDASKQQNDVNVIDAGNVEEHESKEEPKE